MPESRAVSPAQRFSRQSPCPVCGGYDHAERGQGRRCFGFLSKDGQWAHCSREEYSGGLEFNTESNTYSHRLAGECRCGKTHDGKPSEQRFSRNGHPKRIVATFDYPDADGTLSFQVVRYDPKDFKVRRPKGKDDWIWNLDCVEPVPYRLPELLAADRTQPVFIAEGEKHCDALHNRGLIATCNHGGAGKWGSTHAKWLVGFHVVVLPDNDMAGQGHGQKVAQSLQGIARSVRVLDLEGLPEKGDILDWLAQGHTTEELLDLARHCPKWQPHPNEAPDESSHSGWDVVSSKEIVPGKILHFRGADIRRERTGTHAKVEILLNGMRLSWSTLNVDRLQDRRTLADRCYERLATVWGDGYAKELYRADLDDFCHDLWQRHISNILPEEVPGNPDLAVDFVLEPFILNGGGTILFAPPGRGKSWTALLMAASIDAGTSQVWNVPVRHKVLFVNLERSPASIQRRIGLVNTALGLEAGRPLLVLNARGRSLMDIKPVIEATIEQNGVEVVFLDSISRSGQGSLVEDKTGNATIDCLNNLCHTWLALGHTPRADESHIFGTVHFEAGADITIKMTTEYAENMLGIGLTIEKANDVPKTPMQQLALEFDRFGLCGVRRANIGEFPDLKSSGRSSTLQTIIEYILEAGSATATEVAEATGIPRTTVNDHFRHSVKFVALPKRGKEVPYAVKARES